VNYALLVAEAPEREIDGPRAALHGQEMALVQRETDRLFERIGLPMSLARPT